MASEHYRCRGCGKDLELDFGTGTPWRVMGTLGDFHDKNLGTQQDDDDADEPDLCGPMELFTYHDVACPKCHHEWAIAVGQSYFEGNTVDVSTKCPECGTGISFEVINPDPDAPPNEHQRLADAASKLVEAIYPDFVGDLPAALEALAEAYPTCRITYTADENLRETLQQLLKASRI